MKFGEAFYGLFRTYLSALSKFMKLEFFPIEDRNELYVIFSLKLENLKKPFQSFLKKSLY